jgi:hypothetical protein
MQHWHIYRKWNERFFRECMTAYRQGRADKDPAEYWYNGELGFFDFYIIPLARKLKECGVFGVSSDEYLTYALKNRDEWEKRGQEAVLDMVQNYDMLNVPHAAAPPVFVNAKGAPKQLLGAIESIPRSFPALSGGSADPLLSDGKAISKPLLVPSNTEVSSIDNLLQQQQQQQPAEASAAESETASLETVASSTHTNFDATTIPKFHFI